MFANFENGQNELSTPYLHLSITPIPLSNKSTLFLYLSPFSLSQSQPLSSNPLPLSSPMFVWILQNTCAKYLSFYLSIFLSIHLSIYLTFFLFIFLSIFSFIYLSAYIFICLSIYLSIYLSTFLSVFLCLFLYLSFLHFVFDLSLHLYLNNGFAKIYFLGAEFLFA